MIKPKYLIFTLIGIISLTGCTPLTSSSDSSSSHDHSSSGEHTSDSASSTSETKPSEPKRFTVTEEEWAAAFAPGFYENYRLTATQRMEGIYNEFISGSREYEEVYRYDGPKRSAKAVERTTYILDSDKLLSYLEEEDMADEFDEYLASWLVQIEEELGKPTKDGAKYQFNDTEESEEEIVELFSVEGFIYHYELGDDETYERYLSDEEFLFYIGIEDVIFDRFKDFTFNNETKQYEGRIDIEDNSFDFVISFGDGGILAIEAEQVTGDAAEEEEEEEEEVKSIVKIVNDQFDEQKIELPKNYYECPHDSLNYSHYSSSQHAHYKYCGKCHHINGTTITAHEFEHGHCTVCDYYPYITERIMLEGYDNLFGYYEVNILTDAIEEIWTYNYQPLAEIDGWVVYESQYEDILIYEKRDKQFYDDDPCAYTLNKHVKIINKNSEEILWEKETNRLAKEYNHDYDYVEQIKNEHCQTIDIYECSVCGDIWEEYIGYQHNKEIISETELADCQVLVISKCSDCGEEFEEIRQNPHDFIISEWSSDTNYGQGECRKCGKIEDLRFFWMDVDEKHHYFDALVLSSGDWYEISGFHDVDEHGHCTVCGVETPYIKTDILSEYGYTIYGKYVGENLVDFYLYEAEEYYKGYNWYYLYDAEDNYLSIDSYDMETICDGDDCYLITTYHVELNYEVIKTFTTKEAI